MLGQHVGRMKLAREFSILFAVFAVPFSLVIGFFFVWGAVVIGIVVAPWTFFTGFILCITACALIIAHALLSAHSDASWMIIESANDCFDNSKSQRDVLERSVAAQIAINSGSGKMNVKQTAKPIIYRANGDVVSIGIPPATPQYLEMGESDLFWVLQWFAQRGLARAQIVGQELPYSREKMRREFYEVLTSALIEGGAIRNRRQGYSGELVESDPRELIKIVKSKFPSGIRIPLPYRTEN